jgi:hypothetical protein
MTDMHKPVVERGCGRHGQSLSGASLRVESLRTDWSPEGLDTMEDGATPVSAEDFASRAILAICGSGVTAAVGRRAYERCGRALALGATVRIGFRHPGKADAIDQIWRERARLYRAYLAATDKCAVLDELPWIGPVTKQRLARSLGLRDEVTGQETGEPMKAVA